MCYYYLKMILFITNLLKGEIRTGFYYLDYNYWICILILYIIIIIITIVNYYIIYY